MDSKEKLRKEFEKETGYSLVLQYDVGRNAHSCDYYWDDDSISEGDYNKAYSEWLENKLSQSDTKQDTIKEVIKLIDERVKHYKGERKACLKENFQPPYELKIGIQELESLLKLIKMTEDK